MKSLLLLPIGLPLVISQMQKGQPSSKCCHGHLKPDDLFAQKVEGETSRCRSGPKRQLDLAIRTLQNMPLRT
jgi:hypothetical protein